MVDARQAPRARGGDTSSTSVLDMCNFKFDAGTFQRLLN